LHQHARTRCFGGFVIAGLQFTLAKFSQLQRSSEALTPI
jgi:hypothetical protein